MKMKSSLVIVGVCGVFAASGWSADETKQSRAPTAPKAKPDAPASSSSSTTPAAEPAKKTERPSATVAPKTEKIPPGPATSEAIEDANEEHIRPASERHKMETPPPPLRAEKKPPMPAPGLVWVPGHWAPVKGEWQWTPGEWGVPATPISVWIDAKYDSKTKQWHAGYWQPDRPSPHRPDPPERDTTPIPKFF